MHSRWIGLIAFLTAVTPCLAPPLRGQYERRTPIVQAVRKSRESIVLVKSQGQFGRESTGTGIIVDERGFILTSRHLVGERDRASVQLSDGQRLPARVQAADASRDLLILRVIGERPFHAMELGTSSDLMVGETVISIGHPFGYTNSVTRGIISALGREVTLPGGATVTDLIQTDAGINPGSSGGALLNINGELIGINCAIREGANGIAFAISAESAKQFLMAELSALKVSGIVHGLTCAERIADGPAHQRVIVTDIPSGDSAVKVGDEILKVGERTVANRFDIERALWDGKPGERVPIIVRRSGAETLASVELLSGHAVTSAPRSPQPADQSPAIREAGHIDR